MFIEDNLERWTTKIYLYNQNPPKIWLYIHTYIRYIYVCINKPKHYSCFLSTNSNPLIFFARTKFAVSLHAPFLTGNFYILRHNIQQKYSIKLLENQHTLPTHATGESCTGTIELRDLKHNINVLKQNNTEFEVTLYTTDLRSNNRNFCTLATTQQRTFEQRQIKLPGLQMTKLLRTYNTNRA